MSRLSSSLMITLALTMAFLLAACGGNLSTVPKPISPANGAILDNGRYDGLDETIWDFNWSDCVAATQYHLYVIGPHATGPIINDDSITSLSYRRTSSGYVAEHNYHGWTWKVRAKISGQWGEWSETRTFDVEPVDTDAKQPKTTQPTATQTTIPEGTIVEVELRDGEIWVGLPPEGSYGSLNFKVTNIGTTQHQFVLLYAWDLSPDNLPVENNQVRHYSYFDEEELRMWFFLAWPGTVKVSRGSTSTQMRELGPILNPGETTIVNVPFGKPTTNLIIFCNLPGHYESGEYTTYKWGE